MIDLHCHILPELDDGAESLEEACEMAYMAYGSGVQTIVATPHCMPECFDNYKSKEYDQAVQLLQQELFRYKIPVRILPGMEVYLGEELDVEGLMKRIQTINNTRYVLVEFNFEEEPGQVEEYLEEIKSLGYIPIIAHPERYIFTREMPEVIQEWRQAGYLLQVNKGSILGRFGRSARKLSHWMINNDYIDLIGSDAHGSEYRTPYMGEVKAYLTNYISAEYARMLLVDNPQKIISNERVSRINQGARTPYIGRKI